MNAMNGKDLGRIVPGFEPETIVVPLSAILPLRPLRKTVKASAKYRQILSSIRAIGIVEPPVVTRGSGQRGTYLLLDGHLRIEALKDLDISETECLVATDDEAFTYNKRISRLAVVQEHKMIVRAIELGVPEQRIAEALDIDVASIRRKSRLLQGICEEAADLLKDKSCPMAIFDILRKMLPLRQIEAVEFMITNNNYTVNYASALLAGTPQSQLVDPSKPKRVKGVTSEQMARMERELANLQTAIKSIERSYGIDNLNLVVVKGYLGRLLANGRVVRYLMQHCPEYLTEFQNIAEMTSTMPQDAA